MTSRRAGLGDCRLSERNGRAECVRVFGSSCSNRGRSAPSSQTCPRIAPDYGRNSLCTWDRRSNRAALHARFVQRQ